MVFWSQHNHLEWIPLPPPPPPPPPASELCFPMYLKDLSFSFEDLTGSLKCCLIRGLLSTKYFLKCIIDCVRKEERAEGVGNPTSFHYSWQCLNKIDFVMLMDDRVYFMLSRKIAFSFLFWDQLRKFSVAPNILINVFKHNGRWLRTGPKSNWKEVRRRVWESESFGKPYTSAPFYYLRRSGIFTWISFRRCVVSAYTLPAAALPRCSYRTELQCSSPWRAFQMFSVRVLWKNALWILKWVAPLGWVYISLQFLQSSPSVWTARQVIYVGREGGEWGETRGKR